MRGSGINLIDDCTYLVTLFRTFLPVFQFDDEHTARRSLTAQHAVARNVGKLLELRNIFYTLGYLVHRFLGLCQTATRRCRHVYKNSSHVFIRNKSRFSCIHKEHQQDNGNRQSAPCHPFTLEEELYTSFIFEENTVEGCLKGFMEAGREAQLLSVGRVDMGSHQQGTQGGT